MLFEANKALNIFRLQLTEVFGSFHGSRVNDHKLLASFCKSLGVRAGAWYYE